MNAIRLRKRVDTEFLHVPELKQMLGKTVQIIILEETTTPSLSHDTTAYFTSVFPKEAYDPKALEAMRGKLTEEQYQRPGKNDCAREQG